MALALIVSLIVTSGAALVGVLGYLISRSSERAEREGGGHGARKENGS